MKRVFWSHTNTVIQSVKVTQRKYPIKYIISFHVENETHSKRVQPKKKEHRIWFLKINGHNIQKEDKIKIKIKIK
jgi:hypothetical protein